jgi:hypothetical protein
MTPREISWEEGTYSTWWGKIGNYTIGSVSYTGNARTPWVARLSAFGAAFVHEYATTSQAQEAVANRFELVLMDLTL